MTWGSNKIVARFSGFIPPLINSDSDKDFACKSALNHKMGKYKKEFPMTASVF